MVKENRQHGAHFDNESFADFLRQFADAVENGDVLLHQLDEGHTVHANDIADASLRIAYSPLEPELITPLEYNTEDSE